MVDGYSYAMQDNPPQRNVVEPPQPPPPRPEDVVEPHQSAPPIPNNDQPIFSTAPAGGITVVDRPAMPQPLGFRVTGFQLAAVIVAIAMITTFISLTSGNEKPSFQVAPLQEANLNTIEKNAISSAEQSLEEANTEAKIALRDTLIVVTKSKANVLLQSAIADGKDKKSKCFRFGRDCYFNNTEAEIITKYTKAAENQDWDTMALLTFQYEAIQDARKGEITIPIVRDSTTASLMQKRLNTQIRTDNASVEAIATELKRK